VRADLPLPVDQQLRVLAIGADQDGVGVELALWGARADLGRFEELQHRS